MPKLTSDFKKQIKTLDFKDLEMIALKCASRDRFCYEYILVNFLNPEYGEQDLFEKYKLELDALSQKTFAGRTESKRLSKLLKASNQLVKQFKLVVKKANLEVELYLHLLEIQFEMLPQSISVRYQVYDNAIARTLKKVIDLVKEKLHEDYLLEYEGKINGYLLTLHRVAPYNTHVKELPKKL
jgi:hypothetical protein